MLKLNLMLLCAAAALWTLTGRMRGQEVTIVDFVLNPLVLLGVPYIVFRLKKGYRDV